MRLRSVFRSRPFAVLYAAEAQSTAGDQLARIALAVLVFEDTNSAVATSLAYAATFLPAIFGGTLLAGIGDRLPRKAVMVGADIMRAALFAAMVLPGLPVGAVIALLVVAVFVGPAFTASEVATLASALDPERFRAATALRQITSQVAQVVGFALGGLAVAGLHPRGALLLDAGTYLLSALVIAGALRTPPPVADAAPAGDAQLPVARHLSSMLWRNPRLRGAVALCWLAGFFVVPEGLAVPFGRAVGATTSQTGLLFASIPLGGAFGAFVLTRAVRRAWREATAYVMALVTGLPLLACIGHPGWPAAAALWLLSGVFAAYQVEVTTVIVQLIPDAHRTRLLGIVSAGLIGAQGLGLGLFGLLAQAYGPVAAVALAGGIGSGIAALLWVRRQYGLGRAARRRHHAARHARIDIRSRSCA